MQWCHALWKFNGEPFQFYINFLLLLRFEVFMVVTMKNAVFRDVVLCGSCKNQHITSIIWVTRTDELGTMLAVTSNQNANENHLNCSQW
jgi:hypothetical protein